MDAPKQIDCQISPSMVHQDSIPHSTQIPTYNDDLTISQLIRTLVKPSIDIITIKSDDTDTEINVLEATLPSQVKEELEGSIPFDIDEGVTIGELLGSKC